MAKLIPLALLLTVTMTLAVPIAVNGTKPVFDGTFGANCPP